MSNSIVELFDVDKICSQAGDHIRQKSNVTCDSGVTEGERGGKRLLDRTVDDNMHVTNELFFCSEERGV